MNLDAEPDGSPDVPPDSGFSHLDDGESRMVDVTGKPVTRRSALARARVVFPAGILARVFDQGGPKGDGRALVEVARTAGILAAKRTGEWIPMCHPLSLDHVGLEFEPRFGESEDSLEVLCRASCCGPTGVEMEAMVGASAAALTVYDMTKALSKGTRIEAVELLEKTGGRSGTWRRSSAP